MEELNKAEKGIQLKLTLLRIADNETEKILEKNKIREIQRQKTLFEQQIDEISKLKMNIIALKLECGGET